MTRERHAVGRHGVLFLLVALTLLAALPTAVSAQDGPSDNRLDFGTMWENFYVFILFVIIGVAFIGMMGGSFTLASFGAFAVFVHLAVGTGDPLLTNVLTVALVVVLMSMGFKIWRAEGLA